MPDVMCAAATPLSGCQTDRRAQVFVDWTTSLQGCTVRSSTSDVLLLAQKQYHLSLTSMTSPLSEQGIFRVSLPLHRRLSRCEEQVEVLAT